MSDVNAALHAFHFLRPAWLASLPLLWGLALWLSRRRRQHSDWSRLIDPALRPALQLEAGTLQSAASPWPWLALAWTLAALALSGPSWQQDVTAGYRAPAAWVVVLDLSPSMASADLPPNRYTRARYAIDDLLTGAHGARVGLVVFSDEPYTVSPLTEDVSTVRALLPPLAPSIMPSSGDALAPALQQASDLLQHAASRDEQVIVITDGFDDPTAAFAAAQNLQSRHVRLSVIGVGTAGGAPLRDSAGAFTQDDKGHTLMSRLDSGRLQALATAGGGAYYSLSEVGTLTSRLQSRMPAAAAEAADGEDIRVEHWRDAGVWLLPFLLLLSASLARRGWL